MQLRIALLASLLIAALPSYAESSDALRDRIAGNAPEWLRKHDVPSVAIAYIRDGKVAWTSVHGEQSPGVPATGKTIYNVASLTKPIAAETILRLVSEGKISLDEAMSAHWIDPDIAKNPWHELLTPRLALTHQMGFTNWRYQTKDVLQFQWKPGTQTGYSGEGYEYVARFAEKKLGRPFDELVQQYVFDPVGMKDTALTARPWQDGRLAHSRGANVTNPPVPRAKWSAADDLQTTISDYAKFVVSVMRNERIAKTLVDQRLTLTRNAVKPEEVTEVCTAAKLTGCTVSAGMGLGWEVLNFNGTTLIRHGGSDRGVRAIALFVPAEKTGVVVFTAGDNGGKVIREVFGILYPNPILLQILR